MPLDFPSAPTNGQVYDQWQWDGSKWVSIVGILPAGPTGPTGATGPQGIPGVGTVSGMTAGQIPIAASATAISSSANLSGDITSNATLATTLATVNANVGTFAVATVNAKGLVTAAAAMTGDVTTASGVATLATVNANVGTFQGLTLDGKGRVTAASNQGYVTGGPYLPTAGGTVSGALTPAGGLVGRTSGTNAAAGQIGEVISAAALAGSPIGVGSGVSTILSIPLTAGDWDVYANAFFQLSAVAATLFAAGINTVTNVLPDNSLTTYVSSVSNMPSVGLIAPSRRFNLAGSATLYLIVQATFSSGTCNISGQIWARRS